MSAERQFLLALRLPLAPLLRFKPLPLEVLVVGAAGVRALLALLHEGAGGA